ncbi:hypothetical protein ACFWGD_06895 [Corynebacterium sp. NPDC060344]|uniref:hypothetical protein n=1 Tax=Corynebacterium sp. NPDC060344 TaxID=3347101 RepID=UPI0036600142
MKYENPYGQPGIERPTAARPAKPQKPKKPIWKRWWFITIVVLLGIGFIAEMTASPEEKAQREAASVERSIEREAEKSREAESSRAEEASKSMEQERETEEKEKTTSATAVPNSEEPSPTESDPASANPEEDWLREQFAVESFTEILMTDPSLWGGYVNGVERKGDRLHVRLQVNREADQDLADRAAPAIANLVRFSDDERVKGIDWVVVEDGAGVHMAQEMI